MSAEPSRRTERLVSAPLPEPVAPLQGTKTRRRISGLGYIRDGCEIHPREASSSSKVMRRRSTNSPHPPLLSPIPPTSFTCTTPETSSDLLWHRRSPAPIVMTSSHGFSADNAKISAPSTSSSHHPWRISASHREAPTFQGMYFPRYERYEHYPSSHTTFLSSPPSSSSPMFSDMATSATTSSDANASGCWHFHDPFTTTSPLFHAPPPPKSPNLVKPPSSSRESRLQGLGLVVPSNEPLTRRRSMSHSSAHSIEDHMAVHGGLDRWFPGLMYAFEPMHESTNHTPSLDDHVEEPLASVDDSVDYVAPPSAEPHSPPLRSLQLVSKYFGDEDPHGEQNDPILSTIPGLPRGSPGEIHGLGVSMSPRSPPQDMPTPLPQKRGSRLRPLHLAEMHRLETHVPAAHASSGVEEDHVADVSNSMSLSRPSHARHQRIPFAILHPPSEKAIADPDAVRMFWYGFLGMPWLWLLGGWCLDDHGMLLSPWSPPSFASYRAGLHPYGPPFALSMHAHNQFLQRYSPSASATHSITLEPNVFGPKHRGVQFLAQYPPDSVRLYQLHQWQHTESFVLLNRMAAALSSFTFFACWATGVWTVVAHF